MNTHDIDIELPAEFCSGNSVPVTVATIKRERMEEIIRAAIEADRKRRGEPVGHFYPWELERSLKAYPNGFPGAVAVFAAPQPAEPIVSDVEAIVRLLESREWAEHVATTPLGQRLETAVTVLVGADQQPAEPVKTLIDNQEPLGEEFQRVLDEHSWDLYVKTTEPAAYHPCTPILIEGLKRLPGGSEILAEWDRARSKVDAPQPSEPVKFECPKCGADRSKVPCAGELMNCHFKGEAQSAEPVKVPSDDDIRRVARDMYLAGDLVWLGFDKDENGEYTQPKISRANITLIRALLARYGQPAEPVKSHLKVSYDDKGDCLYVVCDSNEPADAEEDDKGILYRRAISDGRLVGITITNFMGQNQGTVYDETHDGLQPQHLTGEHRPDHGSPA